MVKREKFNSRLGFILASAASAVGIGNLVGFPVFASKNGGSLFLLAYLVCMFLVCLPVLIAELALGRNTKLNPYGAYSKIGGSVKAWRIGGILALITPFMIAVFYQVISTWILGYLIMAATGNLDKIADPKFFDEFIVSDGIILYIITLFIMLALILGRGVQKGIERVAMTIMPLLLIMLVFLILFILFLDNAFAGVRFYLVPDFAQMNISVINGAMSQAFFSLSLGMGIMISYGSYSTEKFKLSSSAKNIAIVDTGVAFLAGLLILPAIFVFNPNTTADDLSTSSVSLIFTYLPKIFLSLSSIFGYVGSSIFATAFFLMVLLAALTSQMSIMQVPLSAMQDQFKWSLGRSIGVIILLMTLFIVPCLLSFGQIDFFTNFASYGGENKSFFDVIIDVFYETILPLNGFIICALVIFKWKMSGLQSELDKCGSHQTTWLDKYVRLSLQTFIPIILLIIVITTIAGKYF